MNILNIRNAKYIEPTNTFIDLILETDEGDIPFTYHPDDDAPASKEVKARLGTFAIDPYIPYVPTLDELKAAKIAEIGAAFNTYVSGRTPVSLGWDMQFNLRDIQMVDGAIRIMETTGDTEGYLTDADNVNHYGLTIDQMKQALLEMGTAFLMAHAKKQQLRDAVGAATSAEQLDAIVW